jgi:hypothetical protein
MFVRSYISWNRKKIRQTSKFNRLIFGHIPGTPVSSTNKTDHQDITEILLKVASNTINQTGCRSNHTIKPHILLIPNYDLSL